MSKTPLSVTARPFAIAAMISLLAVPAICAEESSDDWSYELAIYGWLPSIEGELRQDVPGLGDEVVIDPGTLIDNLVFTAMVAFSANHGSWSILADVIYLSEEATRDLTLPIGPGIDLRTRLELEAWIVNFGGSREIVRSGGSTMGIVFGARYLSMDQRLTLQGGGPLQIDASSQASNSLWNGIVGLRGRIGLSEHWHLPYYLDIGAGDADFTWQALAGVEYDFRWGSLALAYRYLDFDLDATESVSALSMGGAAAAVSFRF